MGVGADVLAPPLDRKRLMGACVVATAGMGALQGANDNAAQSESCMVRKQTEERGSHADTGTAAVETLLVARAASVPSAATSAPTAAWPLTARFAAFASDAEVSRCAAPAWLLCTAVRPAAAYQTATSGVVHMQQMMRVLPSCSRRGKAKSCARLAPGIMQLPAGIPWFLGAGPALVAPIPCCALEAARPSTSSQMRSASQSFPA
eukprot:3073220-Prymnesium_polylepis.2